MREDGRNAAGLAGRFGSPGARVKIFDNNLVYAIVSGKDADRGSGELSVALVLTRAHGYLVPMHSRRSLTGPRIMGDHVEEIISVQHWLEMTLRGFDFGAVIEAGVPTTPALRSKVHEMPD